jgi:hypothetical protein
VKTFKTERRPILALVMAISPAQISLFLRINSVYRKKATRNLVGRGIRLNADFYLFLGNEGHQFISTVVHVACNV